jgi:hypothetical protein
MSDTKTRPLWITIAVLSAALAVTVTLLLTRSPSAPDAPPTAANPTPTTPAPTPDVSPQYKGPGTPSPFAESPEEKTARERLLVISGALDLHFRKHYDFPDRLEALIATDLLKPKDLEDPWRRPVDYTRLAKERFKLCSRGKDATSLTDDDLCIGPGGRTERATR